MYYANFARDGYSLVKRGLEVNVIDNMAVAFKLVVCKQWMLPITAESVRTVSCFDRFLRFIKRYPSISVKLETKEASMQYLQGTGHYFAYK